MATAKKTAVKKSTAKKTTKATPKKVNLNYGEKYIVWFAVTVVVVYLIYLALRYFI